MIVRQYGTSKSAVLPNISTTANVILYNSSIYKKLILNDFLNTTLSIKMVFCCILRATHSAVLFSFCVFEQIRQINDSGIIRFE